MSRQQSHTDKEILHGNAKRFDNMLPIYDNKVIGDYDVEGYENVPSEDFDPGFGCVPVFKKRVVPPPPEFTPELIKRLAEKEAKTTKGKMWQFLYKEQLKNTL